jgi:dihydropyrimidine dehydrogenase (NAD+) subunit PreT
MTAYPHEVQFIRKEGVEFCFLTQPVRVLSDNGMVTGVGCVRMTLGAADGSGRRVPHPVKGTEFTIPLDQVVKAVGQEKPALAVRLGLAVDKGYIQVNSELETNLPGVFAGGDCIRAKNAASTVMAVQDGKLAAAAIDRRMAGKVGA